MSGPPEAVETDEDQRAEIALEMAQNVGRT